jgi:hypothetical protein
MSEKEKLAPVQGYSAGIPWAMHLRAYDAYCKRYGEQKALIDLEGRNCRGGFGVGELDMFIPGWRDELSELVQLRKALADAVTERERLNVVLNTPVTEDFIKGVPLEAAHQRERWGCAHDAGKAPLDWFWLIGYLAQKAATSAIAGDIEKAKHHTISTAAALSNWHLQLAGGDNRMRPGIADPEADRCK